MIIIQDADILKKETTMIGDNNSIINDLSSNNETISKSSNKRKQIKPNRSVNSFVSIQSLIFNSFSDFRMMMKLCLLIWPMVNHRLLLLHHHQHYPKRTNNKKHTVIYVNVHFVINIFSKLISRRNMVYSISLLLHRNHRQKINLHHLHQQ